MQSQKLVSFFRIYFNYGKKYSRKSSCHFFVFILIMVKMQSQRLVSFFRFYFIICKNAVAKARVIFYVFLINFSWQN